MKLTGLLKPILITNKTEITSARFWLFLHGVLFLRIDKESNIIWICVYDRFTICCYKTCFTRLIPFGSVTGCAIRQGSRLSHNQYFSRDLSPVACCSVGWQIASAASLPWLVRLNSSPAPRVDVLYTLTPAQRHMLSIPKPYSKVSAVTACRNFFVALVLKYP